MRAMKNRAEIEARRKAFKAFMQRRDLKAKPWAEAAGVTPSVVSNYLTGRNATMQQDNAEKLAESVGASVEEIFGTAKGNGHRLSQTRHKNAPRLPQHGVVIPEGAFNASGGGGANVDNEDATDDWILPTRFVAGELRAQGAHLWIIPVIGTSMVSEPPGANDLNPGDRIIVNTSDTSPTPMGLFLVWDGIGLVAKEVEHIAHSEPPTVNLRSFNPRSPAYQRTLEEVEIRGRIVGKISRIA